MFAHCRVEDRDARYERLFDSLDRKGSIEESITLSLKVGHTDFSMLFSDTLRMSNSTTDLKADLGEPACGKLRL